MPRYEYKVVPAPRKGQRSKGIRCTEGRFANVLQELMNQLGAEGWEYQRTDTLPCEERSGLTGKTTVFRNMLIFRRALDSNVAPMPVAPQPSAVAEIQHQTAPETPAQEPAPSGNGAEEFSPSERPDLGGVTRAEPGNSAASEITTPEVRVRA